MDKCDASGSGDKDEKKMSPTDEGADWKKSYLPEIPQGFANYVVEHRHRLEGLGELRAIRLPFGTIPEPRDPD